MIYIGVDFGGTKIEVAALSKDGTYLATKRAPNPGSYVRALSLLTSLIEEVEAKAREANPDLNKAFATIGIGSPGSLSPRTGLMRNSNSVYLNGERFLEDLEAHLGRPIKLANDANCLALSEAVDGAAAKAQSVFGVILGTGCGGGLVYNGQLINGANGIAGEWGHMPLPWPNTLGPNTLGPNTLGPKSLGPKSLESQLSEIEGPQCWCGLRGCMETWVSGSGFAREFREVTGGDLRSEEIMAAMRSGDPDAQAAFERFLDRLGRGLAVIVNIFDPEVIVFGGGLSNVAEIYDLLPSYIAPHVFSDSWGAKLLPAKWGDASGVRGAAYLWK
jgi:fructokinase